ncbi:tRNA (N(6)-L-threonylcarbamoyladenosine(37)-C(2))-methylthiotransferase, partial [Candidatus Pacearchaeota archaeon]|nr:tRNA (N(6)-L-threonylcarbamoyladenosine(37)-C(2))-methylthiotransferase [Candidatus Pacearchaeota archaeon]
MKEIKNIYIETYGCSANQNNSEIIAGILKQAGLDITDSLQIADIVILNTCIVKGPTEQRMISRIKELSKLNKKFIIAGCMPDVHSFLIKEIAPKALLIGSHHVHEIGKAIKRLVEGRIDEKFQQQLISKENEIKVCVPKIRQNKIIGITQILEGCLGECKYCITRFAKGKLFSYPASKIVENIKQDLNEGCKEIWLTSQDNAAYGLDFDPLRINKRDEKITISRLPYLLNDILSIKGNFYVRLGMMNPDHVLPILNELIECYKSEKMYKFLHLPIQSGSDKILMEMNRKYKVKDFLRIVREFRKYFPYLTLSTDIIVGYPTEMNGDFEKTVNLIKEIKPQLLNISRFHGHAGTEAARLKQLDDKIIKKRSSLLTKLHSQIALEENKKLIGKEFKILVNKHGFGKTWLARTQDYRLIALHSEKNLLGKFINVRIN